MRGTISLARTTSGPGSENDMNAQLIGKNPVTSITAALFALAVIVFGFAAQVRADVAYTHPPHPSGGQYKSSWYAPDGLDDDQRVWDAFTLASNTAITEVRWRGAYTHYLQNAGLAPVYDFTVAIYRSIAGGFQPDVVYGPLVEYEVGGNAGETAAGIAGGVNMYDYAFVLPSPFQAVAGTKYWVQIVAWQGLTPTYHWPPDWSIARGVGPDNAHFRRVGGTGGSYASITGDCAFTLMRSNAPTYSINASANPANSGTITGAGAYPSGSTATLTASPNTGFGFVNWTENGSQVSTNSRYSFTVTRDRTLVANFVEAFTINASAYPSYGGTVEGAGVYNSGSTVTLVATPAHGFVFSQWSDGETSPTYEFPAEYDLTLTAFFELEPLSRAFDFDNGPIHTSLPINLSSDGLTAYFSATGGGYSIQRADAMGFAPEGFEGLCVYPNSVFSADLIVDFSRTLVDFSILYSPQELGCDDSATMRVTVYNDGAFVGTNTVTAEFPGTWPSETLSISAPAGFNRAVVHYAARPPTCQDWGSIFLADNVVVTMAPTCTADFDQDGFITGIDYDLYVAAFEAGDASADFDADGFITGIDFDLYVAAFEAGC